MLNRTLVIAQQTFQDGMAGLLMRAYLLLILLVVVLSWFAAELAIIEPNAFRLAITVALVRPLTAVVVILQICGGFNEAARTGQLQLVLSMDLSRSQYLTGRMIGGAGFAGLVAVATIFAVAPWSGWEATLIWATSLFFEMLLMSLFTLFVAVTFSSLGAAVLLSLSFYLLCRFIEPFVLMASASDTGLVSGFLVGLSWLLPNFGRYSQSSWLVYGDGNIGILSALLFEVLVVGSVLYLAALIDFNRREI